jgi:glutathione S-transferase
MIVLHEHPLSPYVRKVKICMLEKGLAFERKTLAQADFESAGFTEKSPRREVPALVDGDLTIVDSTIICEYLEERYPDPPLYPKSPAERARVRMLEEIADTSLEAAVWGLFEVRFFGRATGELADKLLAAGTRVIERELDRIEKELQSRPFLTGDTFGIADAAYTPHVAGAALFGVKGGPSRPKLGDWVKRVRGRPSVQRDEADVREIMGALGSEDARARPRQYRDHRLEWMLKSGGLSVVLDGIEKGTIQFAHDA